jgi:D-2-hydroxyacid dehydrogenase (NADP+)
MTTLLIALAMAEDYIASLREPLRAHFPGLRIQSVDSRDKVADAIGESDIFLSFPGMADEAAFGRASRLKWVQLLGTGTDRVADSRTLNADAIVTNLPGLHGAGVSEAAIGLMLALARNLPLSLKAQEARQWVRAPGSLLDGKVAAIFGVGTIASTLAPRLKALGMRVIGISSAPREVAGFERIYPREMLVETVRQCDFLIALTPLTPATNRIINESLLRAMKRGSFFINLGRGATVDEDALVRVLADGHLAGAGLDALTTEPLPQDHALWAAPNTIITPHMGGVYREYPQRALPIVEENLRRFLAGAAETMLHRVARPGRS